MNKIDAAISDSAKAVAKVTGDCEVKIVPPFDWEDSAANLKSLGQALQAEMFFEKVLVELTAARSAYPKPINSLHEGLALIQEEFCEFQSELFSTKNGQADRAAVLKELVQIVAMCFATAQDCGLLQDSPVSGQGKI